MATRREFVRTATAALVASARTAEAQPMPDPRPLAEVPTDRPIRVGALVFPRMDQIDLTGPFAVLSRLPNATVRLLWQSTDPIRDSRGLGLIPDARLADAGPIDLLVVPGGPGQEELMEDDAVRSFITDRAATATCVFSVCTGALVCGAAGLLQGRRATTHWASVQLLRYFGATAVDQRVVVDGKLVSAAGLTAGIDGALRVAAMLRGEGDPARPPVRPGAALRLRAPGQGSGRHRGPPAGRVPPAHRPPAGDRAAGGRPAWRASGGVSTGSG